MKTGLDIDKIFSKLGYAKENGGKWVRYVGKNEEERTPKNAEEVLLNLERIEKNFKQTSEEAARINEKLSKPIEKTVEIERAGLIEPLKFEKIKKAGKVAKEDYLDEVLRAV